MQTSYPKMLPKIRKFIAYCICSTQSGTFFVVSHCFQLMYMGVSQDFLRLNSFSGICGMFSYYVRSDAVI